MRLLLLSCLCVLLVACGGGGSSGTSATTGIPNAAFTSWSTQKVGTKLVYDRAAILVGVSPWKMSLVVTKQEPDKTTLQQSLVFQGPQHGSDSAGPVEIKSTLDPAHLLAAQPTSDDLKAAADETITVPAGTFTCKRITYKQRQSPDGTLADGTLWFSDRVPGGLVKLAIDNTGMIKDHETYELSTIEK